MSADSQKQFPRRILKHLRTHGDITPMEALHVYGCYRLSSVINRLRNRGYPIGTRMRRDEMGKQYAQYYLVTETHHQATVPLPLENQTEAA